MNTDRKQFLRCAARVGGVRSQRGAALIIGLVLLAVMLMLGLSAQRGTNLQVRLASNYQFKELAFQTADENIRRVVQEAAGARAPPVDTPNVLVQAVSAPADAPPQRAISDADAGTESTASVRYLGQGVAPGFSLGAGKGTFVAFRFEIDAQAQGPVPSAQSRQRQGISRIGPGSN